MSEQKKIKFKFNGKEETFPLSASYKDLISSIKDSFSLDDESVKKLILFYYEDQEKILLADEDDYLQFIGEEDDKEEKLIEGEIKDKNSELLENNDSNINKEIKDDIKLTTLNDILSKNNDNEIKNEKPAEPINENKEEEIVESNKNEMESINLSQSENKNNMNNLLNSNIEEDTKFKSNIEENKDEKINKVNDIKINKDDNQIKIEDNKEEKKDNDNDNNNVKDNNNDNGKNKEIDYLFSSDNKNIVESIINPDIKKENEDSNNKETTNKEPNNEEPNNKEPNNEEPNNKETSNKEPNNKETSNKEPNNKEQKNNDDKSNKTNTNDNTTNEQNINKKNNQYKENNKCSIIKCFLIMSVLIGIIAVVIYFVLNFDIIKEKNNNMTIIGIDFGSTFSGYSIIYNSNINFEDPDTNQIISSELIMEKDDKIALRIGKKAHNFPKNRIEKENKLYFSKFKKNLDPKVNNNYAESNIPEGVNMELEHVIKGYLLLLKEEIQDNNERIKETNIKDIKWIITVPPLWDDKGKKFMKQVAIKAGMINTEIALEPEAASLAIFHDKSIKKKFLENGRTFLIVDAGGYTVDISANKIIDNNHNLEQLLKPTSYKFGSNLINEKIIEIIEQVYGKDKIEKVKKDNYEAWEKTLDEIEEKKKQIDSNTAENFKLNIKFNEKKCGYMSDNCEGIFNGTKIPYTSTHIDIPSKIIQEIISEIAFNIVNEINKSFSKTNENIDLIVLTGGFSSCKIFEEKIRTNFRGSLKELVFLKSPQESVMKGAAIFGLRPNQILYRISPITIGVDTYDYIDENEECEESFNDKEGELRCLNYQIFVERGKSIKTNEIIKFYIYPSTNEINVYYSYEEELNKKNKFRLDQNTQNNNELENSSSLSIPYNDLPLKNRTISVSMKFSNYLNVTVMDENLNKGNWKIFYYPS